MMGIGILSFISCMLLLSLCDAKSLNDGDEDQKNGLKEEASANLKLLSVLLRMASPNEEEDKTSFLNLLQETHNGASCGCTKEDCQCCSEVSQHKVCTKTNIFEKEPKVYAVEGKVVINNGSVFNYSAKLDDIPDMCFAQGQLNTCIKLKYELVEGGKIKVCGHVLSKYSTEVVMNVDFLCRVFEIIKLKPKPEKNDSVDENEFESMGSI